MKNIEEIAGLTPQDLKELLRQRWPEAVKKAEKRDFYAPKTGIPELDALFPQSGLPKGTCVGIFGSRSSGKVSLAFLWAGVLVRNTAEQLFYHKNRSLSR
ncbi:MAG: hypothetical protein L0196_07120 [candidate division Zixibacteria bacterium]|nr:hypothetical protein [candidate division Zixibacteria bacterium]